jgi:hypothetical protein
LLKKNIMSVKISKNGASNIDQLTDVQIGGDFALTNNDILQYKANSGLWINSPTIYTAGTSTATSVTGTTTETISNYVEIPASFVEAEGTLRVRARIGRGGNAGNVEVRIYGNDTNSLVGATQLAIYLFSAGRTGSIMKRDFFCESRGNFYCVDPTASVGTDDGTGWATGQVALDNRASQFIIVSVKQVVAGDTTTIQNVIAESIWSQLEV